MERAINELKIPELSLVTLIGISGSGKSTFARKHFKETEIVSSDRCRAIVSDDERSTRKERMEESPLKKLYPF